MSAYCFPRSTRIFGDEQKTLLKDLPRRIRILGEDLVLFLTFVSTMV